MHFFAYDRLRRQYERRIFKKIFDVQKSGLLEKPTGAQYIKKCISVIAAKLQRPQPPLRPNHNYTENSHTYNYAIDPPHSKRK